MSSYKRSIRVSTPDGKRIIVRITAHPDGVRIEVPYLKIVEKDLQ